MVATSKKDIPLEAVRGLAAIAVMLGHTILGFFPQWMGAAPDSMPAQAGLRGQAWFCVLNGGAAVTLFFVLSGFVLTRRFLANGDVQIVVRGVIKRWPRLAGPVVVATVTSWLLFKLGLYRFAQAAAITPSPWLSKSGGAFEAPFEPSFLEAVWQGAFLTFFRGDYSYDSVLWTMRYEFIGSFVSFGLALLVALFPKKEAGLLRFAVIAIVFALCDFVSPMHAAFPIGVALAAFLPERSNRLPAWAVAALIVVALYLFGFSGINAGAFVAIAWALKNNLIPTHIFASVLLIAAVELAPDTFRARLSNRFAERLGALSFPLYLIHVPVLCSLGCWMLVWSRTWATGASPNMMAAAATVVGAVVAAIPLVFFNERWVRFVNAATSRLLSQPSFRSKPAGRVSEAYSRPQETAAAQG